MGRAAASCTWLLGAGRYVSSEAELEGPDMPAREAMGYPDLVMTPGKERHGLTAASRSSLLLCFGQYAVTDERVRYDTDGLPHGRASHLTH